MENVIKTLFDFQRFEQNLHLSSLIAQTEGQYFQALADEDLWQVNAAGIPESQNDVRERSFKKQ